MVNPHNELMGTLATGAFRPYAHRGGSRESPENSLAAFRHATALGFRYLETDIRPTRDGVAVVHHDARLERTTDGRGLVRDRTWQEMRSVRLNDGTTPLRLEELLEEFPDAHVTVDAKEAGSVVALADAVRRSTASDRVCVSSFSAQRLIRARRLRPPGTESSAHPWEVLALRASPSGAAWPTRRATSSRLPRAHRVQVPLRAFGLALVEPGLLARAHRAGLAVDVWTVDDAAEMHRLLDLGVDGIMTDAPSVLRAVLESRAQWHPVR